MLTKPFFYIIFQIYTFLKIKFIAQLEFGDVLTFSFPLPFELGTTGRLKGKRLANTANTANTEVKLKFCHFW